MTDGSGTIGSDTENLGLKTTDHAQNLATGNSGSIRLATGVWGTGADEGDAFSLVDQSNGSYSFKFNNFDDHRLGGHAGFGGPDDFVGWGWLNHWAAGGTPQSHVYSSDFLFTAEYVTPPTSTEVPEPGVAVAFGLGFAGLAWRRRQKRKSA